jgi:methylglutaconyl-CoA hydratase
MSFTMLEVRREGPVAHVTLNRPEVRNAFNETLIAELLSWATTAAIDRTIRCAVLSGAGKAFCAGADVTWMARQIDYSREENARDAMAGARMFDALDSLPFPLIGRIHTAALGGGTGLAAVCDVAVADDSCVFGFTEVRLGIVPALISPFVIAKIGRSAARELFLTGRRFSARRAYELGLVHAVVSPAELDATVASYVNDILASGPEAVATAKALIGKIWTRSSSDAAGLTTETIAARRVSAEGQEGLRAFLDKRRPHWDTSK